MNLDFVAGALTGWLATMAFTLHIVSSPRHHAWMNIPDYVRHGLLVTGIMFTWRSVNFFSVAGSGILLGHINAEGMMALMALTYTITASAWAVTCKVLPGRWWDRLEWLARLSTTTPGLTALPMTDHELQDVARATGLRAIEAGEGAEAIAREDGRRPIISLDPRSPS